MGKIYVILGKTCSGKTTLLQRLKNKIDADFPVSYTSRPQREGEVDGIDYKFITRYDALFLMLTGKSVANRSYQADVNFAGPYPWYYGLYIKDLIGERDKVVITDYEGLQSLQDGFNNVVSIHLKIDQKTVQKRLKNRKDNSEEAKRRIKDDERIFKNKKFDYEVDASKSKSSILKEVVKIIEGN